MIGALTAAGVPPWFMVAHSAGETFDGRGRARRARRPREADRAAGAVFRLHRGLPAIGPGSLRMALTALSNPLRHTPLQLMAGWLPAGLRLDRRRSRSWSGARSPSAGSTIPTTGPWPATTRAAGAPPFGRLDAPSAEIADAVAASCAIPGFYRPGEDRRRRYVDGGVCSASNLDLLAGRGLDLVICLNPLSSACGRPGDSLDPRDWLGAVEPPGERAPSAPRGAQGAPLRRRGAR